MVYSSVNLPDYKIYKGLFRPLLFLFIVDTFNFKHVFFVQGKVDLEELISAFADLGIAIGRNEATNLLKRYNDSFRLYYLN